MMHGSFLSAFVRHRANYGEASSIAGSNAQEPSEIAHTVAAYQKPSPLGDSQKYPYAPQQLPALSGGRGEDNRKIRKVKGNAAGTGLKNCAQCWH